MRRGLLVLTAFLMAGAFAAEPVSRLELTEGGQKVLTLVPGAKARSTNPAVAEAKDIGANMLLVLANSKGTARIEIRQPDGKTAVTEVSVVPRDLVAIGKEVGRLVGLDGGITVTKQGACLAIECPGCSEAERERLEPVFEMFAGPQPTCSRRQAEEGAR